MATAAPEVEVTVIRRKGFWRSFGDAMRDAWDFVVRTTKSVGRAVGRFFSRCFNTAKRAGKVLAVRTRRFGAWAGHQITRVGRWSWRQIIKVPGFLRRTVGWVLRGGSFVVSMSLFLVVVFMLAFAGIGLVAGMAKDGWDEHVHERTVNMSQGREFWDKDSLSTSTSRPARRADDDVVVVTDAAYSRTNPPSTNPGPRSTSSGSTAYQPRTTFSTPDFKTLSVEEALELIVLRNVRPPADISEHLLEQHWKSISNHFKGVSAEEREVSSYFFGRALAARAFIAEPRESALRQHDGWYLARESKSIDQRNQAAGQGHPELALNRAAVHRGIVDEIHRLKEVYASVDS